MSDIFPVNFDLYTQYQLRAIKKKDHFYEIKPVHKISKINNFKKRTMEKIPSEITGKGKFINKKI